MDVSEHLKKIHLKHQEWLTGGGDAHENIVFLLGSIEFLLEQLTEHNKATKELRARIATNSRKVITLCGSTRFKDEFERINRELTLAGNVVISVGVFGHADGMLITEKQKEQLDKIHFQKIDMSDEIFVVNVDGYIGSSTKREIEYAKSQGISVRYLVRQGVPAVICWDHRNSKTIIQQYEDDWLSGETVSDE